MYDIRFGNLHEQELNAYKIGFSRKNIESNFKKGKICRWNRQTISLSFQGCRKNAIYTFFFTEAIVTFNFFLRTERFICKQFGGSLVAPSLDKKW